MRLEIEFREEIGMKNLRVLSRQGMRIAFGVECIWYVVLETHWNFREDLEEELNV